jgi:glycerol-3-phosphate acyltransferase PlsY
MSEILLIIFAYLIGSIPTGVLVANYYSDKDITTEGSGNIGATNVGRVVGKKAGILTLAGDIIKGVLPVILAIFIVGNPLIVAITALLAFLGHIYPLFNNFKGGKGVATALGIFLVISPLSALSAAAIFALLLYFYRYVSLGSIVAAGAMPALMGLYSAPKSYIAMSLVVGGFIIYRHKGNIRRLLDGNENRLGQKKEETVSEELEKELD